MTRQSRFIIYGLIAVGAYLIWRQRQAGVSGLGQTKYLDHGLGFAGPDAIRRAASFPIYTGIQRKVGRAAT